MSTQPPLFSLCLETRLLAPEWIGAAAGIRVEDVRAMPWAWRFDLRGGAAEDRSTMRILRACWDAWNVSGRPLDTAGHLRSQGTGPTHEASAIALAIPGQRTRFRAAELADAWSLTVRHLARLVQRGELRGESMTTAGQSALIERAEIEMFLRKRLIT